MSFSDLFIIWISIFILTNNYQWFLSPRCPSPVYNQYNYTKSIMDIYTQRNLIFCVLSSHENVTKYKNTVFRADWNDYLSIKNKVMS